jgi:hypothetical protein
MHAKHRGAHKKAPVIGAFVCQLAAPAHLELQLLGFVIRVLQRACLRRRSTAHWQRPTNRLGRFNYK